MADINATDLTPETKATLNGSEQFVMFDSTEGKRGTVEDVGDYILQNGDADGQGNTIGQIVTDIQGEIEDADENIGDLTSLTTEDKTDLVSAINEVDSHADTAQADATSAGTNASSALSKIGNLSSLDTTDKTDLVGAVNEVKGQADDNTTALQTKAEVDGAYESMTVGNAEQLVSSVRVTDKTPYIFRTAGGNLDIGDRRYTTLVGADVVENQLVQNGNFASADGWNATYGSGSVANNIYTYTLLQVGAYYQNRISRGGINYIAGHKYLMSADVKSANAIRVTLTSYSTQDSGYVIDTALLGTSTAGSKSKLMGIATAAITAQSDIRLEMAYNGKTIGDTVEFSNVMLIDLTAYFGGSAIADTAYTKEQTQAGSGIAWLKSQGFDFSKYRAYNAGSLESVNPSAIVTRGFNQWDEETELGYINYSTGEEGTASNRLRTKNYIPVLPNTSYYFNHKYSSGVYWVYCWYDENKQYISGDSTQTIRTKTSPSNAHYLRMSFPTNYGTTYNNDICINLHWDGSRDGEYEPYSEHTYALGNVPLHGVFKLVDGNIVAVGDTRDSGGTINRNYATVDLGTLMWVKSSSGNKFYAALPTAYPYPWGEGVKMICVKYTYDGHGNSKEGYFGDDKTFRYYYGTGVIPAYEVYIHDEVYSDAASFKTAMSGVYLTYELATPTTDTADSFTNPQVVDNWGTEEFVVGNDNPVGHVSEYPQNLRDKLESIPNPPNGDGDYIVRQTGGTGEYKALSDNTIIQGFVAKLPNAPAEDGTYKLTCTVADGTAVYSWESEE